MFVVTGANGFIGSALVWDLNKMGITNILCVDPASIKQRPEPLNNASYSKFTDEKDFLKKVLDRDSSLNSIKAIFHMGACSSTTEMDTEYLRVNNTEYTQHLFEYCAENDIPFIYASSGAVYGGGEHGFDDKTDNEVFKPLNPYGDSKLNFDKWVVKQTTTPTHWYGLRFFNVYGPNEYHKGEMSSVVFKAFKQIRETAKLKLFRSHNKNYEDGKQLRDFVYVKDITRWMIELYENKNAKSGIYNLGYGQARTWLDLATNVFKNMNKELNIDWIDIPIHIRHQYQYFTEANISKLKEQGLSTPQWTIEKGVEDYLQNYLLTDDPNL